jgi:hypothetical protein
VVENCLCDRPAASESLVLEEARIRDVVVEVLMERFGVEERQDPPGPCSRTEANLIVRDVLRRLQQRA